MCLGSKSLPQAVFQGCSRLITEDARRHSLTCRCTHVVEEVVELELDVVALAIVELDVVELDVVVAAVLELDVVELEVVDSDVVLEVVEGVGVADVLDEDVVEATVVDDDVVIEVVEDEVEEEVDAAVEAEVVQIAEVDQVVENF